LGTSSVWIYGVQVPQSLYHTPIEKARGSNVRFPPFPDIRVMSAFNPNRT